MSLRKRGRIWWIDVAAPNGERIRRTTGTANKALAQNFTIALRPSCGASTNSVPNQSAAGTMPW